MKAANTCKNFDQKKKKKKSQAEIPYTETGRQNLFSSARGEKYWHTATADINTRHIFHFTTIKGRQPLNSITLPT